MTASTDISRHAETLNSITQAISQGIAGILMDLFAIVLLFFLVKILLFVLKGLISAILKLPVIKQVDKSAGLVLGVVNGFFISYLLMAMLFFAVSFSSAKAGYVKWTKNDLKKSYVAKNMYKSNFIVNILVDRNADEKGS